MIGFRPKPNQTFIERPRLLRMLPEEPGYVVWLEAPYGYGKSVLVSQWAELLESEGWRVLWLALREGDVKAALAGLLGLPEQSTWATVLAALAEPKTLVILEDLEGDPESGALLGPLFKHTQGLVLLASRNHLRTPELPKARSEGRLVHLKAEQLAFTEAEAGQLIEDGARAIWQKTGGWPLPLHLTSLTGELPQDLSLWDGLRESLEEAEWKEVLLLSVLPELPTEAADEGTARLAGLGVVQALEKGYGLHPMAAEGVLAANPEAVKAAVLANQGRLPLWYQAEACARGGLLERLHVLLENIELANQDSAAVMRWHNLCGVLDHAQLNPARLLTLSWAYSVTGQPEAAMQTYLEVARHPHAEVKQRLEALGWALFDLKPEQADQAEALFAEAQPWLAQAEGHTRGVFLTNAATFYMEIHRWAEAEQLLEQAHPLMNPERRAVALTNLAMVRWERHGRLLGLLEEYQHALQVPNYFPYNQVVCLSWIARIQTLLGQKELALKTYGQIEGMAEHNLGGVLVAQIEASALRDDLAHFPALAYQAQELLEEAGENLPSLVRAHWARCLREMGRVEEGLQVLEGDSPYALEQIELALCLNALGKSEAQALVQPALSSKLRWQRMWALAAQYRITRDTAPLQELLALTDVGGRILPRLIPLSELPQNQPELSGFYPIEAVLHSGWREAVQVRHSEIPPLEVQVLGGFAVKLLGQPIPLTLRPKDTLALLTLRLSRERIAEALWSEADPEKSRNNLHVSLNNLRKALEPWGLPTYILEGGLARTKVDLWELDRALSARQPDAVRHLYAELLPGFDLEVVEQTRSNLHQRVMELVLAQACTLSGQAAEEALEWLLLHDPTHEAALSHLLGLLQNSGRGVSARKRYTEYAQHLRREFGLEPPRELRVRFG